MRRRAVMTGFGVLSALGTDARSTWEGLVAGRIGIGPVTLFDTSRHRTHLAAEIPELPGGALPAGVGARSRTRADRIAWLAASEAMADAGLDPGRLDPPRCGVVIGGGGGLLEGEEFLRARMARPARPVRAPVAFFPASTADRLASSLGLEGSVDTILTACSSATIAIGRAASLVVSGRQDVVLSGGVETLTRTTYAGFNALRLVDPAPCRPFDRDRRGLSLGECAVLMTIEERGAARARGARIYAEVAGCGMAADAHHMTAPEPEGDGIARAMRAALREAGRSLEEIDHINAHGTGTEQNDRAETRAIREVFGDRARRIPVVSIKGMVGHCLGAAGAIEAFAAALSIHHGLVPPTAGLREAGPDCDLDYVPGEARPVRLRAVLSNSLAFGGNNGALLLARTEG
jgi:3-oxoacyl-[acyl-carrier-protein] synthase II